MKYLGVLIIGMLLGALAYREVAMWRAPTPSQSVDCRRDCPANDPATALDAQEPIPAPPTVATQNRVGETPIAATPGIDPSRREPVAVVGAELSPADLLIPVQGTSATELTDTFVDARSEGRSHDAIDIMAAAGTPVLAVADGHVEKLFDSARGGLTIYQFEPSGRYAYYYAHLQRYADGLAEKQSIKRGQVIGYVGSTGNADPAAPHLHFAIFLLGPDRRWWEGTAINPYPALARSQGALK